MQSTLRMMRELITEVPLIVDAGLGTASDAALAMEMGFDASAAEYGDCRERRIRC